MELNQEKLNEFLGRAVVDIGATLHAGLVVLGEKLGLYKALANGDGPLTAAELAKKTGTNERYIREWLNAQAAGGYVTYDAATKRYSLTPEQAFALANEDSPAYLPWRDSPRNSPLISMLRSRDCVKSTAKPIWHGFSATSPALKSIAARRTSQNDTPKKRSALRKLSAAKATL